MREHTIHKTAAATMKHIWKSKLTNNFSAKNGEDTLRCLNKNDKFSHQKFDKKWIWTKILIVIKSIVALKIAPSWQYQLIEIFLKFHDDDDGDDEKEKPAECLKFGVEK